MLYVYVLLQTFTTDKNDLWVQKKKWTAFFTYRRVHGMDALRLMGYKSPFLLVIFFFPIDSYYIC
jgi:hypothetical protein